MIKLKQIKDLELSGKRVILRADLNVPVSNGKILDLTRLKKLSSTIRTLSKKRARIIIISHFGRPGGKINKDYSLGIVVPELVKILKQEVRFSTDCLGQQAENIVNSLASSEVALLENLRFYKGEEENDPEFARSLAKFGDIYINDAFSASHRSHASVEELPKLLVNAAGPQLLKEINSLNKLFTSRSGPVAAVVGGSKVSTKVSVINNLIKKTDYIIIGGAMANSFLYTIGQEVGCSMYQKESKDIIKQIFLNSKKEKCEIVLPIDAVVADSIENPRFIEECLISDVPKNKMILDVGKESISHFISKIRSCKSILWNGPLGAFETEPFDKGTVTFANEIAELTKNKEIISVAGGGDTIHSLNKAGVTKKLSYVSTAGGAFLEWIEGKDLPGITVLDRA